MEEKRLLYAIGWVKDAYLEEMNQPGRRKRESGSRKQMWLIAAVIAAMLLLAGCAALVWMRLENIALRQEVFTDEMSGTTHPRTRISMQGFAGTPNFQAAREWFDFLEVYDPDNKILQSRSSEDLDQGEEYYSYQCYSPEMARKIDEICEKYGLQKQGMPQFEQPWENICRILGVEDILREGQGVTVERLSGYIYRSGTFRLESRVTLPGTDQPLFLTIRAVAKTDFDTVSRYILELDSYTQWVHTAKDGTELLLACNDYGAHMFADRDSCFICVSINNMSYDWEDAQNGAIIAGEEWLDQENWNSIADMFDFSFRLKPVSDEDWDWLGDHKKEWEQPKPLAYEGSYADRVRWLLAEMPYPEKLQYAIMDVDGDGSEDLLIGQDDQVFLIYMVEDGEVCLRPFFRLYSQVPVKQIAYDEPFVAITPTYIEICQDNKVLYVFEYTDGTFNYGIAEMTASGMDFTAIYHWDSQHEVYSMWDASFASIPTTRDAVQAALATLVPVEVELLPLNQYPLD